MKFKYVCFLFFCYMSLSAEMNWESYKGKVLVEMSDIPGWCSKEKARILMDFIHDTKPSVCVEIGAFGGATTFPVASALCFLNHGKLYAIDAWDNKAAVEGFNEDDPNAIWWGSLDMAKIHHGFVLMLHEKNLNNFCVPIKCCSDTAVSQFQNASIDFLYIDGNFSAGGTYSDVVAYFPKVKEGGYIWLNDSDNHEKKESVSFLMNNCIWLKERSIKNKCVVFMKR